MRKYISDEKRYGSRILADGICISNNTKITGLNNNDIIIGSSGSGKTGGYVIPNIQRIESSFVVTDTKNQLFKGFAHELEKRGYDVYKIDFANPEDSYGYNPLSAIRRYPDGSYSEKDVISLAKTIVPKLDITEPFWEISAANYLAFIIGLCLETQPIEKQNMVQVCALHRDFCSKVNELYVLDYVDQHPDSFIAKRYKQIMSIQSADKMWSSILGFVNIALEPFDFSEAKSIFAARDSFDIKTLGKRKTAVFLNISDTDRYFDVLANIFYTQTLQILCAEADKSEGGKCKVPVRIFMDDFASGTKIPDFDKIISVVRSRDIYVSIIAQSLSQLESMYDKAASKTILNNCDHILYLGCQDMDTAEFIGTRAGKVPETILSMPRNKAYLIRAGERAVLVNKVRPYSTSLNYMTNIQNKELQNDVDM
ncbi:VirD4-like conjugal transfer protein, CD1115 family [Butyrivibrio sp. AE2015]|uniref:VirD4-like conjugal transfer protein, CD1115 family n=1 Tax=Butyrivibrio sp. AE2015 TaxID=1280663 RepID=UPI0003B4DACB|nr:type IV secretory system conjugative DNA transfer family protein [Butyrivibrio sp. AE2015]